MENSETKYLFNSVMSAYALNAANELGLIDELSNEVTLDSQQFCEKNNLDTTLVKNLMGLMSNLGAVSTSEEGLFSKGPKFKDFEENKGYIQWIIKGYGELLQNLSEFASNASVPISKDGKNIALSGKDYGKYHVDPYFDALVGEIQVKSLLDVGCGSGARLIKLAQKNKDFIGIGVEINNDAVKVAKQNIKKANLEDQITIYQGDMANMQPMPGFEKVENFSCFFMGHDLWPRENCKQVFEKIHGLFPSLEHFIFCDTYHSSEAHSLETPIFTLGFELIHRAMKQYIPTISEWKELFSETNWEIVQQIGTGIAYSDIFLLKPKSK